MKIEVLRDIGRRLLKALSEADNITDRKATLGIGAGGDKTHPIDRIAEDIIIDGLKSIGEPVTIISEEAGIVKHRGGGIVALIDPIDGSRNAVAGIPFFSSSIAIANGEMLSDIKMSYIINLINGDEFWAIKGEGAFQNSVKINSQTDDEFYLVAYEAQSPGKDIKKIQPLFSKSRKTRCFGSTALDMAYLASGSISIFVCPSPSRSFDFGGGYLLVKEAGGIITDTSGEDISDTRLGLERSSPLLASGNERLHSKALHLLRQ